MGAALNEHCVAFFRLGVMQAARLIASANPELGQSATLSMTDRCKKPCSLRKVMREGRYSHIPQRYQDKYYEDDDCDDFLDIVRMGWSEVTCFFLHHRIPRLAARNLGFSIFSAIRQPFAKCGHADSSRENAHMTGTRKLCN